MLSEDRSSLCDHNFNTYFLLAKKSASGTTELQSEQTKQAEDVENAKKAFEIFWQDPAALSFGLEGNFTSIRQKADGGDWKQDEGDWDDPALGKIEPGTLILNQGAIKVPILLRARGMSSLQEGEADFPKLKIKVKGKENKALLKGTPLEFLSTIKLNTHVSNKENINDPKQSNTSMGRLRSENSPLREALAYELAKVLSLYSPATRLAEVQYTELPAKAIFTKHALLIESDKNLYARTGAVSVPEEMDKKITPVDPVTGAVFHLFHKMIGNADVGFYIYEQNKMATEKSRPLFNSDIVKLPDGTLLPLAYDFDLSTFVTGFVPYDMTSLANAEFGLKSDPSGMIARQLFVLRMRMPHDVLLSAIEKIKKARGGLYNAVEFAKENKRIDPLGYANAKQHLDSFFDVIDSVMNTEVLGTANVAFFHDSKGKIPGMVIDSITEEVATLRVGTPLKILGEENNMYKVAIVDCVSNDIDHSTSVAAGVPPTIGYVSKAIKLIRYLPLEDIGILEGRDMAY